MRVPGHTGQNLLIPLLEAQVSVKPRMWLVVVMVEPYRAPKVAAEPVSLKCFNNLIQCAKIANNGYLH